MSREEKQEIKHSQFEQQVLKRNAEVKKWLLQSKGIKVKPQSLKINRSESQIGCVRQHQSDRRMKKSKQRNGSDCLEVMFKDEKNTWEHETEEDDWAMRRSEAKESWNDEYKDTHDDSIALGYSAMSGRSSTARRRATKQRMMKDVADLHMTDRHGDKWQMAYKHHEDSQEGELRSASGEQCLEITHPYRQTDHASSCEQSKFTSARQHGHYEENIPYRREDDGSKQNEEENTTELQEKESEEDEEADKEIIEKFKQRLKEKDESVFYDMFELIITKLSMMQSSVRRVSQQQKELDEKVSSLERTLDVCTQSIDDLDAEMDEINDSNFKLVQAAIKLEDRCEAVRVEVKKIASKINKGCFIVSGISFAEDEDVRGLIKSFFKDQMLIQEEINLQSAHRMGNALKAPIWFQLNDPDDSAIIFKHILNLKNKKNGRGGKYVIREFVDEEQK